MIIDYLIVGELVVLGTSYLPPYNDWKRYRNEFHHPWVPTGALLMMGLLWPLWVAACIVVAIAGEIDQLRR